MKYNSKIVPNVEPGEDRSSFISRCMSSDQMKDEFPSTDQRLAVCISIYDRKKDYKQMEKEWVKFLKDHGEYKKDAIVQVEKKDAESLIQLKLVEKTNAPDEKIVENILSELTDSITKTVEVGIQKGLDSISKEVKKRIPAVAKDHDEEGMGGFKTVGEFAIAVIEGSRKTNPTIDKRLIAIMEKGTPSGANTRDDVEGGFLVPETIERGIWEHVTETGLILPKTDRRTTSNQSLKINGFEEVSRKTGYRDGGVQAYWMAEADEYTKSTPRFMQVRLELHKLGVLMYVTDEELADANVALGPIFTRKAGNAIEFLVNEAFIWGAGAGKPQGVMNSPALVTVPKHPGQQDDSIYHHNISKMFYRMPPRLRNNAQWYIHPDLEEKLEFIAFNDAGESQSGRVPIYLPPGGLSASPYGTLKGKSVIPLEYMREPGRKGDILFANFSQYATLTKPGGGIKSATSMHVRFLFDEQAFKWSFRIDGQSLWPSALEDYNGTTLRSPFITLESRQSDASSSGI